MNKIKTTYPECCDERLCESRHLKTPIYKLLAHREDIEKVVKNLWQNSFAWRQFWTKNANK